MHDAHSNHLEELRKSEMKLAPGQPDVQGWCVCNAEQEEIGKVYDLLVEPKEGKIRYLIIDLQEEVGAEPYKVLVPIGMAELHPHKNEIFLPHLRPGELNKLSPYPYDALKMNTTAGSAVPASRAEFGYEHEHFSDHHFRR